jgi:NADH:ubiquinone oxidoreductase subunit K
MMQVYFLMTAFALFSIAIAGFASSRHIIIMVASAEAALAATTLVALANYGSGAPGQVVWFLFVVWAIAAAEVMVLIAFYKYLSKEEMNLDISRLSDLGEE